MQPLRLLAASLLASASAVTAAAQAPPSALPLTATIHAQPLTLNAPAATSTTFLQPTAPGTFTLNLSKSTSKDASKALDIQKGNTILLAQTNQPCAKLRSYNFTPRDLKSAHPHPSSETDCTPASSAHLKTIPATVDTK